MKTRFAVNTWLQRRFRGQSRKRSVPGPQKYSAKIKISQSPSSTFSEEEQPCPPLRQIRGLPDPSMESIDEQMLRQRKVYDPTLPLPPLLALPLELQQAIIEILVDTSDPGLVELRGVNRYFHSIVTPAELHKHGLVLLERNCLKEADRLFAFLKPKDKLPCSLCLFLRPTSDFHWKSRQKALGSKWGHTRFCMDCGIKHGRFGGGNSIKVDNQGDNYRLVCYRCLEFLDQPPRFETCSEHRQRWYLRMRHNRVY